MNSPFPGPSRDEYAPPSDSFNFTGDPFPVRHGWWTEAVTRVTKPTNKPALDRYRKLWGSKKR